MDEQIRGADWLEKLFNAVSAALMILITGLVSYSVILRYFFNAPPIWGEDVPRVMFVWMTYVAIVVVTKRDMNIRVTYFIEKVPPLPRLVIQLVMDLIVVVMLLVLAVYSLPVIELNMGSTMITTGWSEAVTYLPLPFAAVLMVLFQARRMRVLIRQYRADSTHGTSGGGGALGA